MIKTPVSKRDALATLQDVGEFARKAVVIFSDLRSRCELLDRLIRYNSNDPVDDEQIKAFEKLIDDWMKSVEGLKG